MMITFNSWFNAKKRSSLCIVVIRFVCSAPFLCMRATYTVCGTRSIRFRRSENTVAHIDASPHTQSNNQFFFLFSFYFILEINFLWIFFHLKRKTIKMCGILWKCRTKSDCYTEHMRWAHGRRHCLHSRRWTQLQSLRSVYKTARSVWLHWFNWCGCVCVRTVCIGCVTLKSHLGWSLAPKYVLRSFQCAAAEMLYEHIISLAFSVLPHFR